MKLVATALARKHIPMLVLLTLVPVLGTAETPKTANPDMGFTLASADLGDLSPQKHEDLVKHLNHAAKDISAGKFARAMDWYEAALQLAPERTDIQRALTEVKALRLAQEKSLDLLPPDSKDQLRFFEVAYNDAMRSFNKGDFVQAHLGFQELWITAGDYNGKTVTMWRKSLEALRNQGAAPARSLEPVLPAQYAQGEASATARSVDSQEGELLAARAAMSGGRPEEARRLLNDVLENNPLNAAARQELERVDQHLETLRAMEGAAAPVQQAQLGAPVTTAPVALAPAVASASSASSDADVVQANRLLSEAERMIAEHRIDPARGKIHEAQRLWPESDRAAALLRDIGGRADAAPVLAQAIPPATTSDQPLDLDTLKTVDSMLAQARAAYNAGDLKRARELWNLVLETDPPNKLAQTFLKETQMEYDQMIDEARQREDSAMRRQRAEELLDYPIQFQTEQEVPLQEFMYLLSFATPEELQYYIAEGARAPIYANFVDIPLRDVLDTVLVPRGLAWSIDENNVITITPRMFTKTYSLTESQVSQLRTLQADGRLQSLVWGQSNAPAEGVRLDIDERGNLLLVTGSQQHLDTVEQLLPSLASAAETELSVRFYKINPADGPKIRAVINSLIQASENRPFEIERRLLIDEDDMIIRETAENLRKIEELLADKGFIKKLRDEELGLRNFSLIPRDVEEIRSDQIQVFTARVVEAIKVFLYAQEGESQAAEEGRRNWFDESTMQLTLVDTPSNLERVQEYVESLPELGRESQQRVIFLKYQVAGTLVSSLETILNLTGGGASSGATTGEESVITLSRGDERTFRNARIRLVRVEENDEADRNDDSAEIVINDGINIQNTTLRELDTQYTGDYEVTAENVLPSSGQPGEGRAEIRIRYVPRQLVGQQQNLQTQILQEQIEQTIREEAGISINPFGELNALVIRYSNPSLFQQALDLIEQLDQPTKQVSIETKFVEVNESRAKEFSSDFNIGSLGSGQPDIDFDAQSINTRFAQDNDEFRDIFSPPLESPLGANLIKGTTVLEAVIGAPGAAISYNLRLLEAEGILNVVTGPKVTALNGIEAEFRIEAYASEDEGDFDEDVVQIVNPFAEPAEVELADLDNATQDDGLINAVVLRVQPEITSEDSIILRDLQAEIIDFGSWLGSLVVPAVQDTTDIDTGILYAEAPPSMAISNISGQMIVKRKRIATDARIDNGGTIILGGWTGERSLRSTSGVPVLRNLPYVGKLFFSRDQNTSDRTTLLIFLTASLV